MIDSEAVLLVAADHETLTRVRAGLGRKGYRVDVAGLSGLEMLRALKADPATRDMPVLVLSNSSREQDVREVESLGVVGCIVKSNMSLKELGERIDRVLAG
ncbi:MAG: hypothetical protein ACRELS_03530 [Candidatus Rokuibacteriota bacterium]